MIWRRGAPSKRCSGRHRSSNRAKRRCERPRMAIHLGVDIGGTFTDVVLLDTGTGKTGSGEMGSGRLATAKVPTSTRDPIGAISAGKKLLPADHVAPHPLNHPPPLATTPF